MLKKNLSIIYAGEDDIGNSLQKTVEPYGWKINVVTEVMPALAMFIIYFPDIVIIDDVPDSDLASLVCRHLLSIGAEPLLILASDAHSENWNIVKKPGVQILPRTSKIDKVVHNASRLVQLKQELQIERHYSLYKNSSLD